MLKYYNGVPDYQLDQVIAEINENQEKCIAVVYKGGTYTLFTETIDPTIMMCEQRDANMVQAILSSDPGDVITVPTKKKGKKDVL